MTTAREVLESAVGLPTLSNVVARLARLQDDEKAGAQEFERVVTPDPALTANLLRLANSPFFGVRRKIESVKQAIALLGIDRVFEVAVSASFSQVLPPTIPGFNVSAADFFTHSYSVGVMAENLASRCCASSVDLVFTAGLLHDVGKLAIGALLWKQADDLRKELTEEDIPFIDSEQNLIGTNHTEVGELMVDTWGLPHVIGVAARWHHFPESLVDDSAQMLVDLTHVADCLSHMMGFGADIGELKRELSAPAMNRLDIDVSNLEAVALETADQIKEMSKIFGGHR